MPKTRWAIPLLVACSTTLLTTGCGELRRPGAPSETVMAPADTAVDTSTASATTPTTSRSRRSRGTGTSSRAGRPETPPAAAPDTVRPPAPRPSPAAGARSDLQRLVTAQEQHVANVGRYASRTQYLGLRYMPHAGVTLTIETATDSGWSGRATRDGWPGASCVVWVGKVPTKPRTERFSMLPLTSGVAVCDSI